MAFGQFVYVTTPPSAPLLIEGELGRGQKRYPDICFLRRQRYINIAYFPRVLHDFFLVDFRYFIKIIYNLFLYQLNFKERFSQDFGCVVYGSARLVPMRTVNKFSKILRKLKKNVFLQRSQGLSLAVDSTDSTNTGLALSVPAFSFKKPVDIHLFREPTIRTLSPRISFDQSKNEACNHL